MRVRAIAEKGYFNHRRIKLGEEFDLPNAEAFSPHWMAPLDKEAKKAAEDYERHRVAAKKQAAAKRLLDAKKALEDLNSLDDAMGVGEAPI